MPTDFIDEEIGSAVVKKSFQTRVNPNRAKEGGIGGCAIQSGIIKKDHHFRIYRKNECIYEGTFSIHPKYLSQNIYQNLNQIPLWICPTLPRIRTGVCLKTYPKSKLISNHLKTLLSLTQN